jgi:hypothetical protein
LGTGEGNGCDRRAVAGAKLPSPEQDPEKKGFTTETPGKQRKISPRIAQIQRIIPISLFLGNFSSV